MRTPLHCEWCGVAFWRKKASRDARRFCSKTCSGARRRAQLDDRIIARHVERAITRAHTTIRRALVKYCTCGTPITKRTGRWCDGCFALRIGEGIKAGHAVARVRGQSHICPNCGKAFKSYARVVCCSRECGRVMTKAVARGRYPSLRDVPLEERNRLAILIALQREANRRLHTWVESTGKTAW